MESNQCLEHIPGAVVTKDLCLPSIELVTRHIADIAKKNSIQHVFVASDVDPKLNYIKEKLGKGVS